MELPMNNTILVSAITLALAIMLPAPLHAQTQRESAVERERQDREIKASRERDTQSERERKVRESAPDPKRDMKADYIKESNGRVTKVETTPGGTRTIVVDADGTRREVYSSRADQHKEQVDYAVRNGGRVISNSDGANERARQDAERREQQAKDNAERRQAMGQRKAP